MDTLHGGDTNVYYGHDNNLVNSTRTTSVYIDGFNLYFGLVRKGWRRYLWLNVRDYATSLLAPSDCLVDVHYFTARVKGDPQKELRQSTYLDALHSLPGLTITYGYYTHARPVTCPKCRGVLLCQICKIQRLKSDEKQTDVNMAVQLLKDAYAGKIEKAILVTADADLVAAVSAAKGVGVSVEIALPPKSTSKELLKSASSSSVPGRTKYRDNQLPDPILVNGVRLNRPLKWV